MAMPHAGVIAAAKDPINGILQPEDLAGVGEYFVSASVVSPAVNVLCVNMNATELSPLLYAPNSTIPPSTINRTVVDDLFEWGIDSRRNRPAFPKLPIEYNSLLNISVPASDSIYLLVKAEDKLTPDYTMCQIRSYLNVNCSTRYNVSGITGGHLQSHCDDPNDKMSYNNSVIPAYMNYATDWRDVASEWGLSLSLNTGISNANSSTSRLLAQFITVTDKLQPLLPSLAEHLAVMAGNTLIMSTKDASYYHFWNYSANIIDGHYEQFNATLATEEYTSGLTQRWQGIFYVVLFLVFACNVFCLVYLFFWSGLVTDYTETQNLFALAVNSPPSRRLHGSCGAGPEGEQLNVDWHIEADDGSGHFFIKEGEGGGEETRRRRTEDEGLGYELRRRGSHVVKSMSSYSKLNMKKRGSWL